VTVQGVDVPALGYGTFMLSGDDCQRGVEHALRVGYRHVDTAQMYENEDRVGAALAGSDVEREEVFLATKVANDAHARDDVIRTTEESLRRLRTGYIDLLLIHWPVEEVPLEETLSAMRQVRDQDKVRHIGVSNFPPSLVREGMQHATIFCDQVEMHPYLGQRAVRQMAAEHDFLLTAYSPLARGEVLEDQTVREIAEAHGASPAQVALRWCIEQDHVAAIPKATAPERIEENFRALDLELSADEIARIDALDRGERTIDPPWAPDWEE
jgi:diketogulonate reductase-like aldo/keto reductase